MGVQFYAAEFNKERRYFARLATCDCLERYSDLWDAADAAGEPYPDTLSCDACRHDVDLANVNAAEVLAWLGILKPSKVSSNVDRIRFGFGLHPFDGMIGDIKGTELAARCRRRLWDEPRNYDPEVPGYVQQGDGHARQIYAGRRPNYLRGITERLLALAESAGDHFVAWS